MYSHPGWSSVLGKTRPRNERKYSQIYQGCPPRICKHRTYPPENQHSKSLIDVRTLVTTTNSSVQRTEQVLDTKAPA